MADIQKTIEVIFGAVDNTGSGLSSFSSSLNSFTSDLQGVTGPVADLTENLIKTEAAILAMGAAMTGVAINEAGKFQGAVSEIGSLFNATSDQSQQLSNDILDFARSSTSSINDINNATYIAISTGTEWAEVTEYLAEAEKLATAGATGLESATAALSRTMNAYGAEATEAQRYSDALFVTVQNGDTNMDALAGALGRVTSTAAGAKVDIETLGSAVATLTTAGVNTNESMTLLNSLLRELNAPSDELKEALGGLTLENSNLYEITKQLSVATGGSSAEFQKLFGSSEAARGAMILGNDTAGVFTKTLDAMANKTGVVSAAYDKMKNDFERINQNLVNNIKATLIDVGEPLLDEYGDAVGALSNVFKALGDSVEAPNFQPVYTAIEGFINEFGTTLEGIATALPEAMEKVDFTRLLDSFENIKTSIVSLFDGTDLTTADGLANFIQGAVDLFASFQNTVSGAVDGLSPYIEALKAAAGGYTELDDEAQKTIGTVGGFVTGLDKLLNVLPTAANGLDLMGKGLTAIAAVQGLSLVTGNVTGLLTVLKGVAAVMAGPAGIIALIGGLALALVDWGVKSKNAAEQEKILEEHTRQLNKEVADYTEKARAAVQQNEEFMRSLGEGPETAEDLADQLNAVAEAFAKNGQVYDVTTKQFVELSEGASDLAKKNVELALAEGKHAEATKIVKEENARLAEEQKNLLSGYENLTPEMQAQVDALGTLEEKQKLIADATRGYGVVLKDGKEVYVDYSGALKETTPEIEKQAKEQAKLAEESNRAKEAMAKLAVDLEKIASNERIKNLELAVELNVAQIEADAKKYVAALESISEVASSISESIGVLTEAFNDADQNGSNSAKRFIEDIIERQEERLDSELELQEKLIQAQIDQLNARTEALKSGDGLITITADGLEQDLQQIMFTILNRIQIKVSEDQDLFLLNAGLGA